MTFYFAWVGGTPLPPLSLATHGDIWAGSITVLGTTWGGELRTSGDIFSTGVVSDGGPILTNLLNVAGLTAGQLYQIRLSNGHVSGFLYNGGGSGVLASPASFPMQNVTVTLTSDVGRNVVVLDDISALVPGELYSISGGGIPQNTFFTFEGSNTVFISNPATSSSLLTQLTISGADGDRNLIKNLQSTAGLQVGQVYRIFGKGISSTATGVFQEDGTILLSQIPSQSILNVPIRITRGVVYPDGGAFNPTEHARFDEQVLSVEIEHSEGNFASLNIDVKNPQVGFLAPTRNVWCWLSWQETDSSEIVPLFHGRLVGVPENLQGEKVSLKFIAQPSDYQNQQSLIANALRVAPYYDPVWLTNGIDDASTILEARTALWHIDRTTLEVSISDIIIGEDGTLEVSESEHLYSAMNLKYSSSPLSGIYVTATVTWSQQAEGDVDITQPIVRAFKDLGSAYPTPHISAYCGDGLFNSWPKPQSGIGGGWSVGADSTIKKTSVFNPLSVQTDYVSKFLERSPAGDTVINPWVGTAVIFPLDVFLITFLAHYDASRSWTETVSFFLQADTQQLVTDSLSSIDTLSLSSSLIEQPIDPGGLTPLVDARLNSYFKTERGQQSFQFLLAYAKARLLSRARAVSIDITVPWKKAIGLSGRWNVHLFDRRLPNGEATGKVTAYKLTAGSGSGMRATITFGCTIGHGGSVAAVPGVGSYADDDYMDQGYQAIQGGTLDIGDGSITYQNFDDFDVEDDGINFFTMRSDNTIQNLSLAGGVNDQIRAMTAVLKRIDAPVPLTGKVSPAPDPASALADAYPKVYLEMKPVNTGGFQSDFNVDVSVLKIPKTIDLES